MLFNRLTRFIAIKLLKKHSPVAFTESQLKILFRSVRKSKRALCGRPLISVKSADKEEVEIHL